MQKRRSNSRGDYNGGQGKKKGCLGRAERSMAKAGSQLCIDEVNGRWIFQLGRLVI